MFLNLVPYRMWDCTMYTAQCGYCIVWSPTQSNNPLPPCHSLLTQYIHTVYQVTAGGCGSVQLEIMPLKTSSFLYAPTKWITHIVNTVHVQLYIVESNPPPLPPHARYFFMLIFVCPRYSRLQILVIRPRRKRHLVKKPALTSLRWVWLGLSPP
jgi:hypothetical protein